MAPGSPRTVLALLFAGVLVAALDIAIVGPALPAIGDAYGVGSRPLSWVFSVYVLFYVVGAPLLAKLSDRIGRRGVFAQSLGLFAAGSLLVAAAPTFEVLLVGRAIQAFGAGGIFPVASAVIAETVPEEKRGRTLGLIGAVFGLAFLLGPLLGGLLLRWSWRWLFLVNVPIAAVLIVAGLRRLPSGAAARPRALRRAWCGNARTGARGRRLDLEPGRRSELAREPRLDPDLAGSGRCDPGRGRVLDRREARVGSGAASRSVSLAAAPSRRRLSRSPPASSRPAWCSCRRSRFSVSASSSSAASLMMLPLVLTLAVGAPIAGQLLDRDGAAAGDPERAHRSRSSGSRCSRGCRSTSRASTAAGAVNRFRVVGAARRAVALRHAAGSRATSAAARARAAHALCEHRPAYRRRDRRRHRRVERDRARRISPRVAHARVRLCSGAHAERGVAR